jgi:futalosine hydrolase
MSHILIVSATPFEIQPLLEKYSIIVTSDGIYECMITEKKKLSVLITGVGMVNTAYHLGRVSETMFDFVINAGICGTFQNHHQLGDVVRIVQDELIEMGAENGNDFIYYKDLGLGGTNVYKENWFSKLKSIDALAKVKGVTVNTVHGNSATIEQTQLIFKPDVESMEGAAFFAGCRRFNNFIQVRSVSNRVEKRDKSKWNIPFAIDSLNEVLLNTIDEIFSAS